MPTKKFDTVLANDPEWLDGNVAKSWSLCILFECKLKFFIKRWSEAESFTIKVKFTTRTIRQL